MCAKINTSSFFIAIKYMSLIIDQRCPCQVCFPLQTLLDEKTMNLNNRFVSFSGLVLK